MDDTTRRNRIREGMAVARASGKRIGRPRVLEGEERAVLQMVADGKTMGYIAKQFGVSPSTVSRFLGKLRK